MAPDFLKALPNEALAPELSTPHLLFVVGLGVVTALFFVSLLAGPRNLPRDAKGRVLPTPESFPILGNSLLVYRNFHR